MTKHESRIYEKGRAEAIWEMGRLIADRFPSPYRGGSEFISVEELHGYIDRITKEMMEGRNASRTDASSNSSGVPREEMAEESKQDV